MSPERPPDIRWEWTRPVFLAAERDFSAHAHTPAWYRARWLIALATFLVFAGVSSSRGGLSLGYIAVLAALMFGLPWLGSRIGARVQSTVRARHIEREARPEERQMAVWVEPEYFRIAWGTGKMELGWSSVRKAVETPEFVLLFCNKTAGYYLPKAAFQADREGTIARIDSSLASVGLTLQRADA
jgi:hypothetical protein